MTTRTAQRRKRAITCIRYVRATLGCQSCGEKNPIVLELHHVIPIGKNRTRNYTSLLVLEKDLALCAVVCANCHLGIGAGEIPSPPAMGIDIAKSFVSPFRKTTTYRKGYDNNKTKLSQSQVETIRAMHPSQSYNQIAEQFGVSKNTIVKVVKRVQAYSD